MRAATRERLRVPSVNPVLGRELKERMRRPQTYIILTLYLAALAAVLVAVQSALARSSAATSMTCIGPNCFPAYNVLAAAGMGRSLFHTLLFCVLVLVLLIVPALTAGAIAGERERLTLIPLQLTLLRPRSILLGKLAASLSFMVLLVVATIPLLGVAFMIGGVAIWELVRGVAMVIVVALAVGCTSLWCSTALRRVQSATAVSYVLAFVLTIGTWTGYGLIALSQQDLPRSPYAVAVLAANPFMATADVVEGTPGASFATTTPFTPMQALIQEARSYTPQRGPVQHALSTVPFWLQSLVIYALIGVACLAAATRRLRTPAGAP